MEEVPTHISTVKQEAHPTTLKLYIEMITLWLPCVDDYRTVPHNMNSIPWCHREEYYILSSNM